MGWDEVGNADKLSKLDRIHLDNLRFLIDEGDIDEGAVKFCESCIFHLESRGKSLSEGQLKVLMPIWNAHCSWLEFDEEIQEV
jgi:hypothetical protein